MSLDIDNLVLGVDYTFSRDRHHIKTLKSLHLIPEQHSYSCSPSARNFWFQIEVYHSCSEGVNLLELEIYIEAPGRGAEILAVIENIAKAIASSNKVSVRIIAETDTSIRSTNLFQNHHGFQSIGNRTYIMNFNKDGDLEF